MSSHTPTFERVAGLAAFVVGACSLLYAIVFLGLVPDDQRKDNATKFFTSYIDDGAGWLQTSWLLIAVAGLATTVVIVALYGLLREVDPAWAAWACAIGFVAALLSAAHGIQEVAQDAKL